MSRARPVLLLLNGELRDPKAVRALARRCRAVICADGGARHAATLGLKPRFVIGDMDSLPRPLPRSWTETSFLCDFNENRSDLDKALDLAQAMEPSLVYIAGALGGGLDHELVNLAALEERKSSLELAVVGGGLARLLGRGRHALRLSKDERFSLLAAPRATVTLSGARYTLKSERLLRGSRGLGNRSTGRAALRVHDGRVWLITGH